MTSSTLAHRIFLALTVFAAPVTAFSDPLDVTRVASDEPVIVLTFDAGSSADGAFELLDVLRASGVRSTIFLTGEFIEEHPDVVLRIVEDGHEVGNHTWSHRHLTRWAQQRSHDTAPGVNEPFLRAELQRTADAFERLTGARMSRYWRAPYGEQNAAILRWAADAGWRHIGWTRGARTTLDTLDWVVNRRARNYLAPEGLARRVLDFETINDTSLDGAIVLMHLGTARPPDQRMATVLPHVIDQLSSRGFRFVTVGQMLSSSDVEVAR